MVELKRYGQGGLEEAATILCPRQERIGKTTRPLIDDSVQFGGYHHRSAYYSPIVVRQVGTLSDSLCRHAVIGIAKLSEIIIERNVAVVQSAVFVLHYDIHRQ